MEEILINTIKINCRYPIISKTICLTSFSEENYSDGIYVNLFYEKINELEIDFNSYLRKGIQDTKEFQATFAIKNYFEKLIEFIYNLKLKSMTRILNIGKLAKEFTFSEEMRNRVKILEKEEIFFMIKTRGDGNCFYRSFMNNYFIELIMNSSLEQFLIFLNEGLETKNAYHFLKCKNEVELISRIIKVIINIGKLTEKKELVYCAYFFFVNLYPDFDLALIKILREITYRFAKVNPDFSFNGLKMKDWIMGTYSNYSDFTKNVIRKMGEQAKDCIINIVPLMLRINLKVCIIDISDSPQNCYLNYSSKAESFSNESFYCSNFYSKEILLLYKPGHYDALFKFDSLLKELKRFGSQYFKPFELLFKNKLNSFKDEKMISLENINKNIGIDTQKEKIEINYNHNKDNKTIHKQNSNYINKNSKEKTNIQSNPKNSYKNPVKPQRPGSNVSKIKGNKGFNNNLNYSAISDVHGVKGIKNELECGCMINDLNEFYINLIYRNSLLDLALLNIKDNKYICPTCEKEIPKKNIEIIYPEVFRDIDTQIKENIKENMRSFCIVCFTAQANQEIKNLCPEHFCHLNCFEKLKAKKIQYLCSDCTVIFQNISIKKFKNNTYARKIIKK